MEHGHGVGPSGTERAFDCGNTCALQSFVVDWMHLLAKLTDRLSDPLSLAGTGRSRFVRTLLVAEAEEPRSIHRSTYAFCYSSSLVLPSSR